MASRNKTWYALFAARAEICRSCDQSQLLTSLVELPAAGRIETGLCFSPDCKTKEVSECPFAGKGQHCIPFV